MNRRSKIHVRWTTDPVVLGYSASATLVQASRDGFRSAAPDYTGSPRTALEYIAGIRRKIGDGTAYALHLTVAATGATVQPSDLRELLARPRSPAMRPKASAAPQRPRAGRSAP